MCTSAAKTCGNRESKFSIWNPNLKIPLIAISEKSPIKLVEFTAVIEDI